MSSYLRITPFTLEVSLVRPRLAVLVALGALACGSPGLDKVAPRSLQQMLIQFMSVVKANEIRLMVVFCGLDCGQAARLMYSVVLWEVLSTIRYSHVHV